MQSNPFINVIAANKLSSLLKAVAVSSSSKRVVTVLKQFLFPVVTGTITKQMKTGVEVLKEKIKKYPH